MPLLPQLAAIAAAAGAADPPAAGGGWVTLNNGVRMPQMTLGTWKYDNDTAEHAIGLGYEAGFRNFMTAYGYCNQWGVAKALKKLFDSGVKRSDVFVSTMTPFCSTPNMTEGGCYNFTAGKIDEDLAILGLDYVDTVIIHAPDTGPTRGCDEAACDTDYGDFRALEDAMKAGKTRSIGVSNYCVKCIECIAKHGTVPQINQVQYHVGMGDDPMLHDDPSALVSYMDSKGILLQAYSALARGLVIGVPELVEIGRAHNKTDAQVALKWIADKGMSVATKADDAGYLAEDIDMFTWNLTKDETARISAIPCNTSWPFGYCNPSWACGYTFPPSPASSVHTAREPPVGRPFVGAGPCIPH